MSTTKSLNLEDFNDFECRTIVLGELRAETQLHIGSGESGGALDNPLLRISHNGREVPYIPGSSLKGVSRAFIESMLGGVEIGQQAISYIFGTADPTKSVKGHASFMDAMPKGIVSTHTKPGVAIDPITGAAKHGMRYSIETIAPGAVFDFKMVVENVDLRDDSLVGRLLRMILREMIQGNIPIGAKTSSGLGVVRLSIESIKVLTKDSIRDLSFEYIDITESTEI